MKISELILKLQKIQEKEGDLKVCLAEGHDYWVTLDHFLEPTSIRVRDSLPYGPSGNIERSLVFEPSSGSSWVGDY